LDDFREDWAEHQLIAAARGIPIPSADEIPEGLLPKPRDLDTTKPNIQNLMVPITSRSQSAGSESSNLSPSHPAFSKSSATAPASPVSSSPFRPRSKTLASLTTSKNASATDMTQREVQLPKDPFVNGQAMEVFLYKDATECPICFIYYPPYLNKTRCCDQAICSECFVQIKRADPHPPEHEHPDPANPTPPPQEADVDPESLVSEPATCPYCQQTEFGVTFEPPPFRRGLAYANAIGSFSSAMSSSSSLNSAAGSGFSPNTHKRRTTSISATASNVVTTDRVRPDWATKLANARSHLARRSAAATALHTAAYLMGAQAGAEQRSFGFSGRSRFGRNRGGSTPGSGAVTPLPGDSSRGDTGAESRGDAHTARNRRRSRMDDLEEMMMMEAIRLSLAAEDERKRRIEKDAAKDAKKRAKEDKKKEKKERKVYGSGASSTNASAMSLSLPGLGRRRGNSASNLQQQITPRSIESTDPKGKSVDRSNAISSPIDFPRSGGPSQGSGSRHLETVTSSNLSDSGVPVPSPTAPSAPSHLRHMSTASNASSASSFVESNVGSFRNEFLTHGTSSTNDTPEASGTNLAGSGGSSNGGESAALSPESMFNFHSLVAMIGKDENEDKDDVARHIEHLGGEPLSSNSNRTATNLEESVATLKIEPKEQDKPLLEMPSQSNIKPTQTTPELMITPETPAAVNVDDESKQLGAGWNNNATHEIRG